MSAKIVNMFCVGMPNKCIRDGKRALKQLVVMVMSGTSEPISEVTVYADNEQKMEEFIRVNTLPRMPKKDYERGAKYPTDWHDLNYRRIHADAPPVAGNDPLQIIFCTTAECEP